MKIELTQKELVTVVRKYYNLAPTIELEVAIATENAPAKPAKENSLAKESNDDSRDLLEDVRSKKRKSRKRRHYTAPGDGVIPIPQNPKLDYTKYGQTLQDFLESGQDFMLAPMEEGVKNSGLLYRYRTAAELYGFRGKIAINAPRNRNELIISIPGKAPTNYANQSKAKAYVK